MNKKDLISIGDMAKLCGMTVKQLRHYDKIGLLKPVYIDPENSYRFYNKTQIFSKLIITNLKALNIPLEDIKKYMDTGDMNVIIDFYEKKLSKYNAEIMSITWARDNINKILENVKEAKQLEETKYDFEKIEVRTIEERKVLFERKTGVFNVHSLFLIGNSLQKIGLKHSIPVQYAPILCFNSNYKEVIMNPAQHHDYEFTVVLDKNISYDFDFSFIKNIKEGLFVCGVYQGNYKNSIARYEQIIKWVKDHNYKIVGPVYRKYLTYILQSKSLDKIVSEFQIPVKKI